MTLDTITHDDVIQEEPEELSDEEYYHEDNTLEDKIIIPSPKVSMDENDIPIIVRNRSSFEERILEASPDASVPLELTPCDICGRKFNPQALERHTKVCEKVKSKPKKIFDAVNKIWRADAPGENKAQGTPKAARKKTKPTKPEDNYKTCEYCQRKFCPNAFDRHVEFCKEKANRLQTSPTKDMIAQAKLLARTKYNPKEAKHSSKRNSTSPSRKASLVSLLSEVSLPPWNLSGRNTPNYSSLTKAEGNLRSSKRNKTGLLSGTKSLGRATGSQYLRQGDAGQDPDYDENWNPETAPKATTLSRDASGRGSIRKPALTKAALLRLSAGEKKADEEEKKRLTNEFGNNNVNNNSNNFEYLRNKSVTPNSNMMTRSAYDYSSSYSRNDRCKSQTPQMSRRSSSRSGVGRESTSPYSWQSFKPVIKPSAYHPLTSARAEPDGIENDDDLKRKDSLEGEYDHSKEYDPFQTAERQMQELLFGTSSGSSSYAPVQKPQPVRPSATSAFSAYIPGRMTRQNTASPTKQYSYSGLSSLGAKPSYQPLSSSPQKAGVRDYVTSPTKFGSSRDYMPTKVSPGREYSRPANSYNAVSSSDYGLGKMATSDTSGLSRANSLRSTSTRNWKDIFPSLTRTPSNLQQSEQPEQRAHRQETMARFCHECGNPFPMAHVRFCCECGVKRLYI
eukprot:TRINITY_DN9282_c0_g1_i1.p1 TRINITY_DN9282_c0_g1~~TRINITY_DN9282_c0_g1_i1.p1  ORF type:complete len:677 (+),score=131.32 TRINITY_DN9282_c0_g1_i1:45-2075(+)